MNAADLVLVTSDYKVIALQKRDGLQIWETVLVSGFFKPMAPFITLAMDDTGVYAHTNNELFRLELSTGAILWRKELSTGRWIKTKGIASIAMLGAGGGSVSAQAAKISSDRNRARAGDGGGTI
jgi:outer membrane protein assembly factor BamB